MTQIVAIFHAGLSDPIHACQFASIKDPDMKVMYFEAKAFVDHVQNFKGVINLSRGVTVLYRGEIDSKMKDTVVKFIENNRNKLMEEWWGYVHARKS